MVSLAIAIVLSIALGYAAWRIPAIIKWYERRFREASVVCDEFYEAAIPLVRDSRTPPVVLKILFVLSDNLGKPSAIRGILWDALLGRIRKRAQDPTDDVRKSRELASIMPNERRDLYRTALASAFLAMALRAGLMGELFMRLMLVTQRPQPETAAILATNLMSTSEESRMAA